MGNKGGEEGGEYSPVVGFFDIHPHLIEIHILVGIPKQCPCEAQRNQILKCLFHKVAAKKGINMFAAALSGGN
jgi:hypothetical protein